MASSIPPNTFDPSQVSIVTIGVPDQEALRKVITKLEKHNIPHYPYHERDWDYGLTAVATEPLTKDKRYILSNYRTWKKENNTFEEKLEEVTQ